MKSVFRYRIRLCCCCCRRSIVLRAIAWTLSKKCILWNSVQSPIKCASNKECTAQRTHQYCKCAMTDVLRLLSFRSSYFCYYHIIYWDHPLHCHFADDSVAAIVVGAMLCFLILKGNRAVVIGSLLGDCFHFLCMDFDFDASAERSTCSWNWVICSCRSSRAEFTRSIRSCGRNWQNQ